MESSIKEDDGGVKYPHPQIFKQMKKIKGRKD